MSTSPSPATSFDRWSLSHSRTVAASREQTWQSATTVTLGDLRVGRLLVALRYLGRPHVDPARPLLLAGPLALLEVEEGRRSFSGLVSQPWRPRPRRVVVRDRSQLTRYDEPGWVKIGMDVTLESRGPRETLLRTRTTVEATDRVARDRFVPYWWVARPFVGLLRRDVLRVIAVRAEAGPSATPPR